MTAGGSFPPGDDSRTPIPAEARQVIGHITENLTANTSDPRAAGHGTPSGYLIPLEQKLAKQRAEFALTAKYPVRVNVEMTREQLNQAYAQIRERGYPGLWSPGTSVPGDRRALTPDELAAARRAAGVPTR